jgi:hypothetical protein
MCLFTYSLCEGFFKRCAVRYERVEAGSRYGWTPVRMNKVVSASANLAQYPHPRTSPSIRIRG